MPNIREKPLTGPMAWSADTLLENDGLISLDQDCLLELEHVAAEINANPFPAIALNPVDFDLSNCRVAMRQVYDQITTGIGFAVIDRLPIDHFSAESVTKMYWLLMSMISQPVAQKWDGTLIYDVLDTGKKVGAGSDVRSSKTHAGQGYHIDNAFNLPPDFVGLMCLQIAREGGESGLVSFETVYNCVLDECPEILPRLYEPFYYDRQREHAPGDELVSEKPIFESDGERIFANYSPRIIRQGYEIKEESIDGLAKKSMDALMEISERVGLGKRFNFEPGQIQVVNNKRIGHRRTEFYDWPEPERRRHLVRIWLREAGRPFYHG
jgi:hypothetical protein